VVQGRIVAAPESTQHATRDTSGAFILDTGAGYLVLDHGLAPLLGMAAQQVLNPGSGIALADATVNRIELGSCRSPSLRPVLLFDGLVVGRAIDRPVLGLLGQQVVGDRALTIDFAAHRLTLGSGLDPLAEGSFHLPFELVGDGKIVDSARVGDGPPASYILDTGATKSVVFEGELDRIAPGHTNWPTVRGLTAPTVAGDEPMRLVRLPSVRLGDEGPTVKGVDAGVVAGPLGNQLSAVTGRAIAGLVGYSFLKRFRIGIDYVRHELRLDPIRGYRDPRPYEFTTVGIQLARGEGKAQVTAVASGSPADKAGVVPGDEILQVGSLHAASNDVIALMRAMEGPAGSTVRVRIRRDNATLVLALKRRVLL